MALALAQQSLPRRHRARSDPGRWISLALCIFFFLAFLAELYLICCRKKDMQEYYESNKPRDERFIRP